MTILVIVEKPCHFCNGTGAAPDHGDCPICKAAGTVRREGDLKDILPDLLSEMGYLPLTETVKVINGPYQQATSPFVASTGLKAASE